MSARQAAAALVFHRAGVSSLFDDLCAALGTRPSWYDEVLPCAADPDLWHRDTGVSIAAAKRGCESCPALEHCRAAALEDPPTHGVWGALTARGIRAMVDAPARKASRGPENDERCQNGHSRVEHATRNERGGWYCRACRRGTEERRQARERARRLAAEVAHTPARQVGPRAAARAS